jgi:hypothetical protein
MLEEPLKKKIVCVICMYFGYKELEECGIKWGRMAGNSEEGQGPQRAVAPMMMMNMYVCISCFHVIPHTFI